MIDKKDYAHDETCKNVERIGVNTIILKDESGKDAWPHICGRHTDIPAYRGVFQGLVIHTYE